MKMRVYAYLQMIPKGKVVTYGQIAEHLGNKNLARAVGNILHQNTDPETYPCYRVVNAKGQLAACFSFGGLEGQRSRLIKDGVEVVGDRVDLKKYQYKGRSHL